MNNKNKFWIIAVLLVVLCLSGLNSIIAYVGQSCEIDDDCTNYPLEKCVYFDADGSTQCVTYIPGWNILYGEFTQDPATGALVVNSATGELVTDYYFDIFGSSSYNFSYTLTNVAGCSVALSFNNNNECLSPTDFSRKSCFSITPLTTNLVSGAKQSAKITISSAVGNSNSMNGIYFKDVRLKLTFSGCNGITLSDISLREDKYLSDKIDYNMDIVPTAEIAVENSCCPDDYCWNGTTCVSYNKWSGSGEPGIWSDGGERAYRCMLDDNNHARWVYSVPKYDWYRKDKGYCGKTSECFVAVGEPCVSNDTFMDDEYNKGKGNHYCLDGAWTTRTYLVAQFLINLTHDKPYVLTCNNVTDAVFNNNELLVYPDPSGTPNEITSCVLIIQDPDDESKDQVITGIITKNDNDESLMGALSNDYRFMYRGIKPGPTEYDLEGCIALDNISGTNFSRCFKSNSEFAPLNIYYEKRYKYFILSEEPVSDLTPKNFWQYIIELFKKAQPSSYNPFASMPLSNYENIYLASNPSGTIIAVDEWKYDSVREKMMNVLAISYNCSNNKYNIINRTEIVDYLNRTLVNGGYDVINPNDVVYIPSTVLQRLAITTEVQTALWPYFTSTLRHRGGSDFICSGTGAGTMPGADLSLPDNPITGSVILSVNTDAGIPTGTAIATPLSLLEPKKKSKFPGPMMVMHFLLGKFSMEALIVCLMTRSKAQQL